MSIGVIKYNAGNLYSVKCALNRLNVEPLIITHENISLLDSCDKVIFPGVGEASSAMAFLREHGLDTIIKNITIPLLGICIGQQLMCKHSEEGDVDCIGIFDVNVMRFVSDRYTIPHVGWNSLSLKSGSESLFNSLENDEYVYYVHSYYVPECAYTIAVTDYINPFSAALHKDNFFSTQFHPEKSGKIGDVILKNFLAL